MNDDGEALMFLTKPSQEEHRWPTQRLRSFRQEQKGKPECSSYFINIPNYTSRGHGCGFYSERLFVDSKALKWVHSWLRNCLNNAV
jgi:hypothetical protein